MTIEYIWMVSAGGVPCRIPAVPDPRCTSETEWQEVPTSDNSSIRTVVSSEKAAFAIDRSGRVLVLVLPTHVAIRERVEIYNNQRWYGKWLSPFALERPRFSDETGRFSKDPSFDQVEAGWSWEEPWSTHIDHRNFDKEGYQYSFFFLNAKWEKKMRRLHMVRRRLLKRHMRYTAHDEWVELSNDESRMFTELAISQVDAATFLFALGTDGNIYHRHGIRTNRPGGSGWEKVPKILMKEGEVDDVTLISMSPTLATLICVTWDGKMYHRQGISKENPGGLMWLSVPAPKDKAVICAAIGTRTMWCVTADGCVWFSRIQIDEKRKEHLMDSVTVDGYQMVTQGGTSRISVTRTDQVFCLSTREKIQVRTGIEKNEPSGKRFEPIVDRGEPKDQKWISIHAGAVTFQNIPEYFLSSSSLQSKIEVLQFKKADWRITILDRLKEASDHSWIVMNNVKGAESGVDGDSAGNGEVQDVRRIRCQIKKDEAFQTVNITITSNNVELSDEKSKVSFETSAIKSVLPSFQRLPQKYLLFMFTGAESQSVCFGFTDEKSRNSFQIVLENIIRDHICASTRSNFGESMWSLSSEGIVRWHCLAEMSKESHYEKRVNFGSNRGLVVEGVFESIDCGAKRLVWAVNRSGALYSLSTSFDPLHVHNSDHDHKMTDEVTLEMFEYQKNAVFRGFIPFQNMQKGVAGWMCDGKPCPASFSSLPSTNWSWVDATWQLEDDRWQYASEINGNYVRCEREQGRARRRVWTRKARFETNKSSWCHVEAPPVKCVRVAKRDSKDGKVIVVVLTKDGHILQRTGVNREHFTGTQWTQILTDLPISHIHLQWEGEVLWCGTTDGLIMSKSLSTNEKEFGWTCLDMDFGQVTKQFGTANLEITGYSDILYVRVNNVLYRIDTRNDTISDAYPMDNLQQTVVNAQGSICLRGTNITVVREWRVVPYTDRKATIIAMRSVERATNMGVGLKDVAFY